MNLDNDRDDAGPPEREISLGTMTILGIFLALALVCAAFFGFGYSLGRRSNQVAASSPRESKSDSTFSNFRSTPAGSGSSSGKQTTPADDAQDDAQQIDSPPDSASAALAEKPSSTRAANAQEQRSAKGAGMQQTHNVAFPVPAQHSPTVSPESTAAAAPGQAIVQVSATSRQGDAESLIAALRRKGYNASIRPEPQDKLYHVQLGPFASKKEADAMRLRLDADGYKAIVK